MSSPLANNLVSDGLAELPHVMTGAGPRGVTISDRGNSWGRVSFILLVMYRSVGRSRKSLANDNNDTVNSVSRPCAIDRTVEDSNVRRLRDLLGGLSF